LTAIRNASIWECSEYPGGGNEWRVVGARIGTAG